MYPILRIPGDLLWSMDMYVIYVRPLDFDCFNGHPCDHQPCRTITEHYFSSSPTVCCRSEAHGSIAILVCVSCF